MAKPTRTTITGILHTIFFHRFFTPLYPATHDVLDLTLPYVSEADIESLIDQRTTALLRQLDIASQQTPSSSSSAKASGRGTLVVQFLERKRRKGWFVAKADEETVWENWIVEVSVTSARSEPEAARNRKQMEKQLGVAAMKVVEVVNVEGTISRPLPRMRAIPFRIRFWSIRRAMGGGRSWASFEGEGMRWGWDGTDGVWDVCIFRIPSEKGERCL